MALRAVLTCPACQCLLWNPALLPCDHIVCETCVRIPPKRKRPACPICQQPAKKRRAVPALDTVVSTLFPQEVQDRPRGDPSWRVQTTVDTMRAHQKYIRQPGYFQEIDAIVSKAVADDQGPMRCQCTLPSLPEGFVVVPKTIRDGRVVFSCPRWPDPEHCRFFRFGISHPLEERAVADV